MENENKVVSLELSLNDTIKLMQSADYKDRFKAEYLQTKLRYTRLKKFNTIIEAAMLSKKVEMPKHDCPEKLLIEQEFIMGEYLHILETRAVIEGIDLTKV